LLKLVIFDMDGLMFDTERATMKAYLDVALSWGLPATEDQFLHIIGKNSRDIKEQYRRDFGEKIDADRLYKEIGDLRIRRMDDAVPVKKGLTDILEFFKKKKITMAVASGSDEETIRHFLEMTKVAAYFEGVLSSKNVKRGKPEPDVFLELCRRFDAGAEETLVLEDSPNGIRAAIAGKIPVIAVPDILPIPDDLKEKCLAVVPDLLSAVLAVEAYYGKVNEHTEGFSE